MWYTPKYRHDISYLATTLNLAQNTVCAIGSLTHSEGQLLASIALRPSEVMRVISESHCNSYSYQTKLAHDACILHSIYISHLGFGLVSTLA
jgi:hypothetical protein